jgi:hypothetical protein
MTYACPAWKLAADTYLLKLQCLQNKVLRSSGNFPRCMLVCNLHTALNLPYLYDYIIKLCRQQAEVTQNHENEHVCSIGNGKARQKKYKRLKLAGGQAYDCCKLLLQDTICKIGMICFAKPVLTVDLYIVQMEVSNNTLYVRYIYLMKSQAYL